MHGHKRVLVTGGTGFLGSFLCERLLREGNDVLCVDVDEKKIEALKRGEIPIHEPGLDELIKRNSEAERLRFTTSAAEGVDGALLTSVSVPPRSRTRSTREILLDVS